MTIWAELGNALRQPSDWLCGDLANYRVCDTVARRVVGRRVSPRTILLCESPHKDELIHKHPLAGDAGMKVFNRPVDNPDAGLPRCPASPIGCLVLNKWHQVLNSIG